MRRFDDYERDYSTRSNNNNSKLQELREENDQLRNRIAELEDLVQTLINQQSK